MSLQIRTHEDGPDTTYSPDELFEECFPNPDRLQGTVVCSDMDKTMFDQDLGILVFLEKLCQPTFWSMGINQFAAYLLPQKYQKVLIAGEHATVDGLAPEDCKLAMQLYYDIMNLYKIQKKVTRDGAKLDVSNPLINEFARKMIALDALFMKMDQTLIKIFRGELLMRTRFFAGKSIHAVTQLARQVMQRTAESPDREIVLRTFVSNQTDAHQVLGPREVAPLQIDRLVRVIAGVRLLLQRLYQEHTAEIHVVTTNLDLIAREALRSSDYRFLDDDETVIASTLRKSRRGRRGSLLQANMATLPVFGPKKAQIAARIANTRKDFAMALGDSATNDVHMGELALHRNGVFVIVGPYEKQRAAFDPLYKKLTHRSRYNRTVGRRMWYVEPYTVN